MIKNSILRTLTIIGALIAFGSGIGIYSAHQQQAQLPPQVEGLMWPSPKVLQPFTVIDHNAEPFGLSRLKGKWSFLFFGYTHCPDICPITLSVFAQIYKKLQSTGEDGNVQMILVSVDPQRDSSEKLHDYVTYFNKDFIGLGGSIEQIRQFTAQLGVAFFHQQAETADDYLVDHAASVLLIDPAGRVIAIMSAPHQADDMLNRFQQIRSFIEKQGTH